MGAWHKLLYGGKAQKGPPITHAFKKNLHAYSRNLKNNNALYLIK